MKSACVVLLGFAVLTVWLSVIAYFRLRTPLQRIHVVTFVNITSVGLIAAAALLNDGFSARSLKCLLIWLVTLPIGALLSHVTGRALYIRDCNR